MIDTEEIRRALGHDAPSPETEVEDAWEAVPTRARRLRRRRIGRRVTAVTAAVAIALGAAAILQSSSDDASRSIVATPPAPDTTTTVTAPPLDPTAIRGVSALAADGEGGVYFADASRSQVWYRSATGEITPVAGTGQRGSSGDGGPATQAQLDRPTSLALDTDGTLYIADQNDVWAVDPSGTIRRVVLEVGQPLSVAVGPEHRLYVVGNAGVAVVEGGSTHILISALDRITVDGQSEPFFPDAIAVSQTGDLYVSGFSPKQLARFDADGNLLEARDDLYVAQGAGLAVHPDGRVIVADRGFVIDAFAPGDIAGTPLDAVPTIARFLDATSSLHGFRPTAITAAPDGTIYVSDDGRGGGSAGNLLRIDPDGTVTVLTR